MNQKAFINGLAKGKRDIIEELIDALDRGRIDYCVIGGLAVNAYVEPVVSLDLDIVVVARDVDKLLDVLKARFTVASFPHSINLATSDSDLRIQIQMDQRYQDFITRSSVREILGYQMKVASLEDVLQGKTWAYSDAQRRGSKRQKDLADILRIVETYPDMKARLPAALSQEIDKLC